MQKIVDFTIETHPHGYKVKQYATRNEKYVFAEDEIQLGMYLLSEGYTSGADFSLKTGVPSDILLNVWFCMDNNQIKGDFFSKKLILTIDDVYPIVSNMDELMERYNRSMHPLNGIEYTEKEAVVAKIIDFIRTNSHRDIDVDEISSKLSLLRSQVLLVLNTMILQDRLRVSLGRSV